MELPRALYHGTPTSRVAAIRKEGLLLGSPERANFEGFKDDVEGLVFLATSEKDGRFFGSAAALEEKQMAGRGGDSRLDFTVLLIDTFKAQQNGVRFVLTQGGLDPDSYDGKQVAAADPVPPEAVVGGLRVFIQDGKVQEERWFA